ncbi:hypothetical protein CHLRE_14g619250v5 [Chlamydomonas reinhardtii]|uniref:Uncharacterized protein n=1 Tax=Chlamydomonas reinhardtii TaxID=3055 RepID=A8HP09_CHLRE|nr:uncharacterized protein CHLRE_14g619250v5 [Chlamydomonas reinhardtii]XP_042916823.1 uncharacterized protein CHLRE_14g619250v5 [Chlamydomonas reinhardtii]PNW73113.1 hypothetical protein CHLRE_14g619250v5 [Chlamydomonas reinhardtii]PNW73114.1 hypothetical protein CHLRE_14g619250v5 [Chlamydomonas reinhardtii]|eukprot:XP_001690297.1 predicted protein [Chlamydomonas reinhardtii]
MATTASSSGLRTSAMDIQMPAALRCNTATTQKPAQSSQTAADSFCFYATSPTAVAFYDFSCNNNTNSNIRSGSCGGAVGSGASFFAKLWGASH